MTKYDTDTAPPVPGRTRNPIVGPCDDSAMPARHADITPRTTKENRSGVDIGTPTGDIKSRQEHGQRPDGPARPSSHHDLYIRRGRVEGRNS